MVATTGSNRTADVISLFRRQAADLDNALDGARSLASEFARRAAAGKVSEDDFFSENADLTIEEFQAALAALNEVNGLITEAHRAAIQLIKL